uniref:Putative ovule protein n=1 Tax=Solanum chacoense TaxID=4108 RepID=A0A0V0HRR0_SOLCH
MTAPIFKNAGVPLYPNCPPYASRNQSSPFLLSNYTSQIVPSLKKIHSVSRHTPFDSQQMPQLISRRTI